MRRHLVIAASLVLSAACSDATLPTEAWVRAEPEGDATLTIRNRGDEPVYVRVSDPTVLALMIGCSPSTCTRIGAGGSLRLPYAQITNYDAGDRQAAVNWWVFAEDGSTRDTGTLVTDL